MLEFLSSTCRLQQLPENLLVEAVSLIKAMPSGTGWSQIAVLSHRITGSDQIDPFPIALSGGTVAGDFRGKSTPFALQDRVDSLGGIFQLSNTFPQLVGGIFIDGE